MWDGNNGLKKKIGRVDTGGRVSKIPEIAGLFSQELESEQCAV
jgi:hypothetical protein